MRDVGIVDLVHLWDLFQPSHSMPGGFPSKVFFPFFRIRFWLQLYKKAEAWSNVALGDIKHGIVFFVF